MISYQVRSHCGSKKSHSQTNGSQCDSSCQNSKSRSMYTSSQPVEVKSITAQKHLLLFTLLDETASSELDMSVIYEIVIFNKSSYDLKDLVVDDSLFGLRPSTGPGDDGELDPNYTHVVIDCPGGTVTGNTFDEIVSSDGNLVASGSYVPAKSVCRIRVRVTGVGLLQAYLPTTGEPDGTNRYASTVHVQNTVLISGTVNKKKSCGCYTIASIYPIYVRSGISDSGFFPAP